jgi:sulfoxide reductase heme-binding subunit YedZ
MKAWISEKTSSYWHKFKRPLVSVLHPLAHIASTLPLLVGVWDYWQKNLGANPILEITHRTGKTALILLMLSLAVSPIRLVLSWPQINKVRRPLGLYAFGYAAIHFLIFIILDYGFIWQAIFREIVNRKFILIGFSTGLILLILAVTSLNRLQKMLGRQWKSLHRLVYLAGGLAVLHFIMAVKPGVLRPWYYAGGMLLLLIFRLSPVQTWIKKVI